MTVADRRKERCPSSWLRADKPGRYYARASRTSRSAGTLFLACRAKRELSLSVRQRPRAFGPKGAPVGAGLYTIIQCCAPEGRFSFALCRRCNRLCRQCFPDRGAVSFFSLLFFRERVGKCCCSSFHVTARRCRQSVVDGTSYRG